MKITEELHLEKDWYEEANNQTLKTLPKFIEHLMHDYEHDYGTICKAMSACMLATMSACNKEPQGHISGFQASQVLWELVPNMTTMHVEAGARIVTYYNMLFPQYEFEYDKTISKKCFKNLQRLAKEYLKDTSHISLEVQKHMQSIIKGKVPFGYKIKE